MLKVIKFTNGAIVLKMLGYGRTYNIDGKTYKCPFGNNEIMLPEIPTKIQEIQEESIILDYKYHQDHNTILLTENYKSALHSLVNKCDEDGNFDNLDDEFAYRKFIESWIPNRTEIVQKTIDLEFDILVVQEIEDKYKEHIYSVVHNHDWDSNEYYCGVLINLKSIVYKLAEKYGFREARHDSNNAENTFSPPHENGRFLKINNRYYDHQVVLQLRYVTYGQAKEHVDKITNIFEQSFKIAKALCNDDKCDATSIGNILKNLIDIRKDFDKVCPNAKTKSQYTKVEAQLEDLIERLTENSQ